MWMWINQLDFEWTEKNRTKSQPTWFKPKINLLLFESWKTVMKFYISRPGSGGSMSCVLFLFAYRTVVVLASIWCFSYPFWHLDFCIRRMRVWMGRGVKSQVSCTSSRFQTPPAPSIPSLSILNCRFPLIDRFKSTIFVCGRYHISPGQSSGLDSQGAWADDLREKSERFEYWLAWSNIYFIDSDVNQQMFYRRKISWIINYEFTTLFDRIVILIYGLNGVYVRYGILNSTTLNLKLARLIRQVEKRL